MPVSSCHHILQPRFERRAVLLGLSATALAAGFASTRPALAQGGPVLDVPYVPTPEDVVDKMLQMAEVQKTDYLIDLGCGDGRIPITAAKRFGIRGYGVDIDPKRIEEANANAKKEGVTDKVRFEVKNLFETPIGEASVLTLYLLPRVNLELRPRLFTELKPGTRIVSHQFDMGDWKAEQTEQMGHRTLYRWTVPARVEGRWRLTQGSNPPITLDVKQDKWLLSGTADVGGKKAEIKNAEVAGMRVGFELDGGDGKPQRFDGRFVDGRLEGSGWKAEKAS